MVEPFLPCGSAPHLRAVPVHAQPWRSGQRPPRHIMIATRHLFSFRAPFQVLLSLLLIFVLVAGTTPQTSVSAATSPLPGDWTMYGHDPQRTSYDPDENILSSANIDKLEQAWQDNIGIGTSTVPAFSAPIVTNGTLYVA